ncbi:spermine oxidase-like [Ctenocephalides felis]|uniref:spermine oxidase-like n=1 Tax=Ctenocephalides felis TaxID=7515 RepID=UPI000E6E27EA|nr:spermine oxidase-like [Ctenocephalides felis]
MAKNIIIIGAGAAGIAAAVKLIKNGLKNVVILEASDRIGGRIYTTNFNNNTVDLGAQWCHGEEGNIVYDIVKDLNLLSGSEMYWNNEFLISNGTIVPKNNSKKLEEIYYEIGINDDDIFDSDTSVGQFKIKKYNNLLKQHEYQDINDALSEQYLDWCHKFNNSIDASDNWFESSAKGSLEYHECPGHPILNWKGAGYIRFLDVLMNKYPDPKKVLNLDIQFKKEVISIEWNQPLSEKPVTIKCKDNSCYEADHVIVTVPLGVLKNSSSLFKPDLPQYKMKCIENLGFGIVDKIFLRFESKWWLPDWNGIRLLWTVEDREKENEKWLIDVFGFYTVDQCPDVLCGWVTGPSAKIMESLSDEQVLKSCSRLLRKFVARHRLRNNISYYSDPIEVLRSKWGENPYSRGSYSLRLVRTEKYGGSSFELSKPVSDDFGRMNLLFAGEATSQNFYSTVHGAVESGFREAGRVISLNNYRPDTRSKL